MTDYDELAARAERGELTPIPGTASRGTASGDAGRAHLMAATGADTLDQAVAVAIALGRPSLDAEDS